MYRERRAPGGCVVATAPGATDMELWHLTPDAPRDPRRVRPGERVVLQIGTWPIEPGQAVWVTYRLERADGTRDAQRNDAAWQRNDGANSFWRAELGPFARGDCVTYVVHGCAPDGEVALPMTSFASAPGSTWPCSGTSTSPVIRIRRSPEPVGQLHPSLGAAARHPRLLRHGGSGGRAIPICT